MMKPLVIIGGATAIGKSKIAVGLAKKLDGEVISADSMQVYKRMDIGTAKIMTDEMQGVKHYLIDEIEPCEDFNVYEFKLKADKYIKDIYDKNKVPIITGGTGFYIQAVIKGIDFNIEDDREYRIALENEAKENGGTKLYEMLKEIDPEAAKEIHPNNVKRIIRALEFYHLNGQKISEHNDIQRSNAYAYENIYFVLNRNREYIYDNINKRVDEMIDNGLIDEVRALLDSGIPLNATSMQGIGYKEICDFINGDISFDEAVNLIRQNTRHYAKRQITWFKREKDAVWIDMDDHDNIESIIDLMADKYKERTDNV